MLVILFFNFFVISATKNHLPRAVLESGVNQSCLFLVSESPIVKPFLTHEEHFEEDVVVVVQAADDQQQQQVTFDTN